LVPFLADLDGATTAGAASTYKKKTRNKLKHNKNIKTKHKLLKETAEIEKHNQAYFEARLLA
jgi:hypothetical protein